MVRKREEEMYVALLEVYTRKLRSQEGVLLRREGVQVRSVTL